MSADVDELIERSLEDRWNPAVLDEILTWPEKQRDELMDGAFELRRKFFGREVRLKFLMNAKSGLCPEDCGYCSQSAVADSEIEKYSWRSPEELLEGARRAAELDSTRYCIVASGRGPGDREIDYLEEVVPRIKENYDLEVCLCLGLLTRDQAFRLADAGVDIVNHNLNTSEDYYGEICSTHSFEDRVRTLKHVREAGMRPCSGGIVGMGETRGDVVDLALSLREEDPDIVPVNFLIPVPGTPLEDEGDITTDYALKTLALFRYVLPESDLTVSAGREWHLGPAQAEALKAGTSLFIGDYLTTKGEDTQEDFEMIEQAGFEVVGAPAPRTTAL